ncbi:MAG: secondary thiamine-phosphate synthase enzyme YjbQ, partial [Chloroflexota bacterium]
SEGDFHAFNVTDQVRDVVAHSGIRDGSALIFYRHTTGAVIIVEHEAGILVDLEDVLEKVVPVAADYKHHQRGYDSNGAAHVRTALLNVSTTVPVVDGDLLLGSYQEILVVDMDSGQKVRKVLVQVMGE